MNKEISVAFISQKLNDNFKSLEGGKFENKQLQEFIIRAIDDLKENPNCGTKICRKMWPKIYLTKYKITNLWKYDLPNAWRLIYTIEAN